MKLVTHKFFSILNFIILALALLWLLVAVLAIPFVLENASREAILPITISFVIILLLLLTKRWSGPKMLAIYQFMVTYKWLVFLILIGFQIFILLTCMGKSQIDVDHVYTTAVDHDFVSAVSSNWHEYANKYYSRYPNNFLLFLVFRAIPNMFFLQIINIIIIDGVILWMSFLCRKFISPHVGNVAFLLFVFLFGPSPYILHTYTDTFSFPLTVAMLHLGLEIFGSYKKIGQGD